MCSFFFNLLPWFRYAFYSVEVPPLNDSDLRFDFLYIFPGEMYYNCEFLWI